MDTPLIRTLCMALECPSALDCTYKGVLTWDQAQVYFALPAGMLFLKRNKNRAWSQVKGVRKNNLKYKVSFDWEIRISDFGMERRSENGFHLREIRLQGGFQLRNPNTDFVDFLFTVLLGKGFAKLFSSIVVFFLLIMRERAWPLFLRTVFQILFRISQSNVKNETLKTDISPLKSVFGFRVRLQIRNPILKSKSRFPNRTHPKKKRCLLSTCKGYQMKMEQYSTL